MKRRARLKIYYRAFRFPSLCNAASTQNTVVCLCVGFLCGLIASKCAIIISFCFHLMMLFIIWLSFFRGWKSAMTVASLSINLILPQLQHTITLWLCLCDSLGKQPVRLSAIKSTHCTNRMALVASARHECDFLKTEMTLAHSETCLKVE